MHPFAYRTAETVEDAVAHAASQPRADFVAGGTDLFQLLKERVRTPSEIIDLNPLPLRAIEVGEAGLRIGALARMSELSSHPAVRQDYPAIAEALLASASPQVRNMASIGGNLLQRTRCLYYRDVTTPCNKRSPGSGCSALDGMNRMNAILGGSDSCIAAHPSDLAVALAALDATATTIGPNGEREILIADLHCLPGDTPEIETALSPGELITSVVVPPGIGRRSHYLKVRDRASFEWALASAAVALAIEDGTIREARVAVGGVATKPWRLPQVENALVGAPATPDRFRAAAELAPEGAVPRRHNAFKVELIRRVVARALATAGARA